MLVDGNAYEMAGLNAFFGNGQIFRRWFYTKLLDLGCVETYVKKLVGHTISRAEAAYVLRYGPEKSRQWMEKVDAALQKLLG